MQKAAVGLTPETTPKCPRPNKSVTRKKSSSQKALMGHKWFKGSPKSRSNQRMSKKLLKSPPIEKTSTVQPIPPQEVEFDLGGAPDRLSVYDDIHIIEMDSEMLETPKNKSKAFKLDNSNGTTPFDWQENENTPGPSITPSTPLGSKKGGRVKEKSGKSGGNAKSRVKSTGKQKNGKTAKTPADIEARKKSLCLSKLPEASYRLINDYIEIEAPPKPNAYIRYMERPHEELADEIEYDLDEEDCAWLDLVNEKRSEQNLLHVKFEDMELLMDRLEKESYFQMQSTGIDQGALIDDDAVCCICMDGECQNSNAILFCDMCNLAVHQECYGVPYIPEGQWLCRRCLQSPSRAVDCALCPNKGGAFKQTDDGRWAHVVCAIWIPEVCFANTVFLEPVDSINNIPTARWRLVCYICKQKGVGACIQCHKGNCYTAFHVTCAQQAGLCMLMDTVRESTSITVKKTAYCDNHAPPESDFCKNEDGIPSPRQKMRQTRKLLAEKRSAIPVLSIPTIPHDRIAEISSTVTFSRKNQFIKRLMAYWKLKRQSRNGVPLLRRLQAASAVPHPPSRETPGASADPQQKAQSQEHYRYWLRLRQDLERARLLCELVRKREKVKRELIQLRCRELELKLKPFVQLLLNVLDEIASKDTQEIFSEPVDINEVPDYFDFVKTPMDILTMREKINSFQYNNIDEFEADFNLMIDNCLLYNSKDTIFYKAAIRLRDIGGIIIRYARRSINSIGFDPNTGLLLPERTSVPVILTDEQIIEKVDDILQDENRRDMPFEKQLEILHEVLDDTLALTNSTVRKKKFNKVKQEIVKVRRLKLSKSSQLNKLSSKSPIKKKYNTKNNNNSLNKKNMDNSHVEFSDDTSMDIDDQEDITGDNSAEVLSTSLSKLRARSGNKSFGQQQPPIQSPTSSKRALRPTPLKRKLSTTKSSKTGISSTSSSSLIEDSSQTADATIKTPPKKTRRTSTVSVASETTPAKLTATSEPAENCRWKKSLTFPSPGTKNGSVREKGRLRERQCDERTGSTITPPSSGVNRRSTILFAGKKGNSTPTKDLHASPNRLQSTNLKSPQSNSVSISPITKTTRTKSNKNKSDEGDPNLLVPTKTSQQSVKNNSVSPQSGRTPAKSKNIPVPKNINAKKQKFGKPNSPTVPPAVTVNSVSSTEKSSPLNTRKIPTRRNSTRSTKKEIDSAPLTMNNNVMSNDNNNWPHNNVISNIDVIGLKKINSEPFSLPWTTPSDAISTNNKNNSCNNDTSTTTTPPSKRQGKKKINSKSNSKSSVPIINNNCMNSSYNNGVDNKNTSSSISHNSSILNNCTGGSSNKNSNKDSTNSKADSFMVYRSGRDRDMESEEEDNDNERKNQEEGVIDDESASEVSSESDDGESFSSSEDESDSEYSNSHAKNTTVTSKTTAKSKVKQKKKKNQGNKTGKNKNIMSSSNEESVDEDSEGSASIHESEHEILVKTNSHARKTENNNRKRIFKGRVSKQQSKVTNDDSNEVEVVKKEEEVEEGLVTEDVNLNLLKVRLKPLDLVWAKCKEGHWYPALIVNEQFTGDAHIPEPPNDILGKKPKGTSNSNSEGPFLVLCFDTKRTWEWITRNNLEPLGRFPGIDHGHLGNVKKTNRNADVGKRALRRAYERAILHRQQQHQGAGRAHKTGSATPNKCMTRSKIRLVESTSGTSSNLVDDRTFGKQSMKLSASESNLESKSEFPVYSYTISSELVPRLPLTDKLIKKCQYYSNGRESAGDGKIMSERDTSEQTFSNSLVTRGDSSSSETHRHTRERRSVLIKKCPCCV